MIKSQVYWVFLTHTVELVLYCYCIQLCWKASAILVTGHSKEINNIQTDYLQIWVYGFGSVSYIITIRASHIIDRRCGYEGL